MLGVFSKYDKHRKLILDDILASIARLPSSKNSLRTFRLSRNENIQMLTALVLQLIQCVVVLPDRLGRKEKKSKVGGTDRRTNEGLDWLRNGPTGIKRMTIRIDRVDE